MADPRITAEAVKETIGRLGGGFMISREAKALCERTGLGGREMYFRGRCGVLGEVHADVVASVCVFFEPGHVRESWDGGRAVPAAEAAGMYAEACDEWGRRRLTGLPEAERLVELLEPVVAAADGYGAPLFAGWRALPLPDDTPARLARLMHLVRELRGGLHAVAVLSVGLTPLEATLAVAHPGNPARLPDGPAQARFMRWPEPYPELGPDIVKKRAKAEELTDELVAPAWSVLGDTDRDDLIHLLERIHNA
ncbi:SCO6745 family protein [Thermostaphylospora chromogena]|uniref:EvbL n=1 Tax=Thermostaphylospora chromogena TaxID=35622 RepID=A0A1H1FM41_9ACTN|nr:hypothetical protein [Thermostaphylospora chromogena]SDR01977.1 hypothetical protein SAMN04489764_3059 [Thermostaphylospora chromogena]